MVIARILTALVFVAIGAFVAAPAGAHVLVDSLPGTISDASPSDVLYLENGTLKIKDRSTSAVETVSGVSYVNPFHAYLSPHGAIINRVNAIVEWRDGQLLDLGPADANWLRVKGGFAAWTNGSNVYRRDLAGGTTITVATDALDNSALGAGGIDVAANGAVAYAHPNFNTQTDEIVLFKNGVGQVVATDATNQLLDAPRTDGTNVVYRREMLRIQPSGVDRSLVRGTGQRVVRFVSARLPPARPS